MPTFTKDPVTGRILMDGVPLTDANAYGTAGRLYQDQQGVGLTNDNPNYQQSLGGYLDESGNMVNRTSLAPGVADRMGGQLQLPQFGVGGYNEVRDPSQLTYNNEFGVMSSPGNISAGDPATRRRGLTYLALIAGGGLAANAGLLGEGMMGGAAEGTAATGAAGATPGVADAGMLNAADWTVPAANPALSAAPELGGGGLMSQLGQYGSQAMEWAQANPLQAARLGLTGVSMAGGLMGGSGASTGGGNGWRPVGGLLGQPGAATGTQARSNGYSPNPYTMAQLNQLYGR